MDNHGADPRIRHRACNAGGLNIPAKPSQHIQRPLPVLCSYSRHQNTDKSPTAWQSVSTFAYIDHLPDSNIEFYLLMETPNGSGFAGRENRCWTAFFFTWRIDEDKMKFCKNSGYALSMERTHDEKF
jgi:hypothetical protein